jgi:uncharacterized protein YwgA
MTSGDLVYSNDTCSAFLAVIVRSFEENQPRGYLGRTAIQKIAYFAKAMGVPIPCSFDIYTYGPYSDAVTFSMESLLADDVVVDRSYKPEYSSYRLGENAGELLRAYDGEIRKYIPAIDRVVKALGGFKPPALEVIATLHFIVGRQRQILRREPGKPEVIDEFESIKGEKFSHEEIIVWYDALKKAGLI